MIEGTAFEGKSLEQIIKESEGGIFNNAAQNWNHTFYWNCMSPDGGGEPSDPLMSAIKKDFASFDKFKELFTDAANNRFGSGWAWLVKNKNGKLEVLSTLNADNPMTENKKPLLTCDVWEHAYYLKYQNKRPDYVSAWWNVINWQDVSERLDKAKK